MRAIRICLLTGWSLLAVAGVRAGEGGPPVRVRAWDFVPRDALYAQQGRDPARITSLVIDRVEYAGHARGVVKNMFMLGMQKALGVAPAGPEIADFYAVLGIDAQREGVMGLLPFVGGRWTSLQPPGMLFLVLPAREPQVLEKLLRERILLFLARTSEQRCARMRSRLQGIASRVGNRPGMGPVDLRQEPFRRLACPCGGRYTLNAKGRVRCDLHDGFDRGAAVQVLPNGLRRTEVGPFDLYGDKELGIAYGVGKGFVVIAPDARVVKACLMAASDRKRRLAVTPLPGGLLQGVFQWRVLAEVLRVLDGYSWRTLRHGSPLLLPAFLERLRGLSPLRFSISEQPGPGGGKPAAPGSSLLLLRGEMRLGDSPWARRLAAVPPGPERLSRFLPDKAPLLAAGNILPEFIEIVADAIAAFGDDDAAIIKLAPMLAGRECAFAMTHARGGGVEEAPHMAFLFSRDDERVGRVLDLLPRVIASMGRMRERPARKPGTDIAYNVLALDHFAAGRASGARIPLRDILFYAHRRQFSLAATSEDDMRRMLALSKPLPPPAPGARRPLPPPSVFERIDGCKQMGGPPAPANLRFYLDVPALAGLLRELKAWNAARGQQRWCFQRQRALAECAAAYAQQEKNPPATLEALRDWAQALKMNKDKPASLRARARRWSYNARSPYCPGTRKAYVLEGGKVSCPVHGRPDAPARLAPRPRGVTRETATALAAFGRLRLELSAGEGSLRLCLRQVALPAPPPPAGPKPAPGGRREQQEDAEEVF